MKTANLIQAAVRKLQRQHDAVADTEHLIRVLRRQLQEETAPTPIEVEAARTSKKS